MLGAIIGDIAGSKYEFNNTFDYDFEMFGEGCDFTDDTICTIAIADAIQNGRSYQESLLDWCRHYPSPKGAYGGRFAQWIRSLDPQPYNILAMVRRCEYRRWLGYSMTCRRFWKRQRRRLFLPITIPKESREPKPWLMPSGISARADSQKNLRSVKIRILKNLMIRQ